MTETTHIDTDSPDFERLVAQVSNWGRWGDTDQLGTLNFISVVTRTAAAKLITSGEVVNLARTMRLGANAGLPQSVHVVSRIFEPVEGAVDFVGITTHGAAITHLDALNHIHSAGLMYNGVSASSMSGRPGDRLLGVETLCNELSGRGVLFDIARHRGVEQLDVDEPVTPDELSEIERITDTTVREGDFLFIRTGAELFDYSKGSPGLVPECAAWMHSRGVALLATDAGADTIPPPPGRPTSPLHVLALTYMGMPIIDNCALHAVGAKCHAAGRSTFFVVVAPLAILGATGSPVAPLAFF